MQSRRARAAFPRFGCSWRTRNLGTAHVRVLHARTARPTSQQPRALHLRPDLDLPTQARGEEHMFGRAVEEVRGFEPGMVPLPETAAAWADLDRLERVVVGAKLGLARRVEESNVWLLAGHRSAADYLAKVSGTSI